MDSYTPKKFHFIQQNQLESGLYPNSNNAYWNTVQREHAKQRTKSEFLDWLATNRLGPHRTMVLATLIDLQ